MSKVLILCDTNLNKLESIKIVMNIKLNKIITIKTDIIYDFFFFLSFPFIYFHGRVQPNPAPFFIFFV